MFATGSKVAVGKVLHAPEPTQDIHGEDGNARSGSNTGECLFRTRFAVGEAVAADHYRNQTCNLRNRAGEKALDGGKAGIERTPLGMGHNWGEDEKGDENR